MLALTVFAFWLALAACVVLMRSRYTQPYRYATDKPQRFHAGQVSRLGGVAVALALALVYLVAAYFDEGLFNWNVGLKPQQVGMFLLVAAPAVLSGFAEDLTHRMSARYRLLMTAASAAMACYFLNVSVARLGVPVLDDLLAGWPWISVALAFVAISGLPHAFNIIDGYNGLAGAVACLVCLAIAIVAFQVGDRQLMTIMMCLLGATAGFLVWNYPRGLIFVGDGGAYLWGIVIAIASITLVQRHEQVSPWFPMLLLIYPVWETIFSIYRKMSRGVSPGVADALHFHQLIYRRIVRSVFHDDEARRMLMRNNRTSPYLWSFSGLTVVPALLLWRNTAMLIVFCLLFVATYVGAYLMIVRFKVPRWLRR